jgi:hypothetical protein
MAAIILEPPLCPAQWMALGDAVGNVFAMEM